VHKRLFSFLTKYKILHNSQHGFQPNKSTNSCFKKGASCEEGGEMLRAELSSTSNWDRRFNKESHTDHPSEDNDEDDEDDDDEIEGFLL
jgi:hypothetical protein